MPSFGGFMRGRIFDHLQAFKFHLIDVTALLQVPVFVPVLGFSAVTAPEMTADIEQVKEGNSEFPRKLIKGASVSTITCQRGATFYDADFWRWMVACVKGGGSLSRRRNLLLVHLMNANVVEMIKQRQTAGAIAATAVGAGLAVTTGLGLAGRESAASVAATEIGLVAVGGLVGIPARAWFLQKCKAVRIKTGSDFDALNSGVSIQELDIECEFFEEFSLTS